MLSRFLHHRYFIWGLLALPLVPMTLALLNAQPGPQDKPVAAMLLHPTGEFAARFMIVAMVITPMRMLLPGSSFWNWMEQRRRYFGVAAFAYGLVHTLLYIVNSGTLAAMLAELGIWTGWVAFLIFIPLAITSKDLSVRRIGRKGWKTLQRWVYPAAVLTLLQWIFIHNEFGPALVHFVPLAALETYRILKSRQFAIARPVDG